MFEKLNQLMNSHFSNDGWGYHSHTIIMKVDEETGEEDEEYVAVEEAIADLFQTNGYANENFSVIQNIWSTSPATDEGYVSVAWCENGKLHHEVYELYDN